MSAGGLSGRGVHPGFEEVASAARFRTLSLLQEWFPEGKLVGREYEVGNLAGAPGNSLRINVQSTMWSDFATGDKGGDLISLLAAKEHISQGEAARRLVEDYGCGSALRSAVNGNGNGNGKTYGKAKKDKIVGGKEYEIKDTAGRVVAIHKRIEYKREPGEAKPRKDCIWLQPDRKPGLGGIKVSALPLYGSEAIPGLVERAVKIVDVTEGEKPADALRARGYAALGTVTGADEKGVKIPDDSVLEPLKPFIVRLWADNDLPGHKHMDGIAGRLLKMGVDVRMVIWKDAPPKGDAEDFKGSAEELKVLLDSARPFEEKKVDDLFGDSPKAPPPPVEDDGSGVSFPFRLTPTSVLYGVEGRDGITDWHFVCSRLEVLAATRNADSAEWGRLVRFADADGRVHELPIPMAMLAGDAQILRELLLSEGLIIAPQRKAREWLSTYIQNSVPSARVRCVPKAGWCNA
jgi:putative DNA primase/helicase